MYAARSNQVPQDALLPPEAPAITVWYCAEIDSPFRWHSDCLGAGSWLTQSEKFYDCKATLIRDLVTHKQFFWRHHCEKGLFFLISCLEHADTEEVINAADIADMAAVIHEADMAVADIADMADEEGDIVAREVKFPFTISSSSYLQFRHVTTHH